jgi:hypothetical protein
MLILFVLFLLQRPVWFFWIELSVGNLLLAALILQQQRIFESLDELLTAQREGA